jgi:hypothetical protein
LHLLFYFLLWVLFSLWLSFWLEWIHWQSESSSYFPWCVGCSTIWLVTRSLLVIENVENEDGQPNEIKIQGAQRGFLASFVFCERRTRDLEYPWLFEMRTRPSHWIDIKSELVWAIAH